jgi:hypothetical protein
MKNTRVIPININLSMAILFFNKIEIVNPTATIAKIAVDVLLFFTMLIPINTKVATQIAIKHLANNN